MKGIARRGFTLIETLFAIGGFVLAGLLTFALFKYGMTAHQRGVLGTDVQRSTREFVNRLSSDLQSSMALQLPALVSVAAVQSPVLCPSTLNPTNVNDIAFIVPALQKVEDLDLTSGTSYVLVRYARCTTGPLTKRAIVRRAYPYAAWYNKVKYDGSDPKKTGNAGLSCWYIDPGALDTTYGAPGNTQGLATTDTGWQEVLTCTGPDDLVSFSVSHAALVPASTIDPVYDPYHFTVKVAASRYLGSLRNAHIDLFDLGTTQDNTDNQNDRVRKDISTEVTLQHFQ
ncbi:MAG: hypothetical protein EB084_01320 [Proteobacteria bacterium]|nr:hypothetical protein [Pseudomonadota bacterium]